MVQCRLPMKLLHNHFILGTTRKSRLLYTYIPDSFSLHESEQQDSGTDPEDLKGGWLDTVAKGIAAEVGNGRLCGLSRGVWGHAPPDFF